MPILPIKPFAYRGLARNNDRFIGMPCGCVVVVRGYDLVLASLYPNFIAASELIFSCEAKDDQFKSCRMTDFVSANVYYECQAILEPKAEGLRWQ